MSILGSIISTIFGHASAAPAPAGTAPGASPAPAGSSASAAPKPASAPGAAPAATVDVAAVLTKLAANNKEKLDWQKSIVDLMKLLNLDSSFTARKQLAAELHYSGDTNDFSVDEHLAAQTGDAEACGERRQGSRRTAKINDKLQRAGRTPLAQPARLD